MTPLSFKHLERQERVRDELNLKPLLLLEFPPVDVVLHPNFDVTVDWGGETDPIGEGRIELHGVCFAFLEEFDSVLRGSYTRKECGYEEQIYRSKEIYIQERP